MKTLLHLFFYTALLSLPIEIYAQMTPTYIVSIPMRDSKNLAADVYVPTGCTSCPTILIQTPYNKNSFRNGLPLDVGTNIDASPYAFVVVDWRGFYGSFSATIASPKRGEDGYDVIDWITAQSWSNDSVGTWGPSALGQIQYQTAKENHPAHICAVPSVAYPQTSYESYFYGGVLEKARLEQLDALGYGLSTTVLANPYYNTYWQFAKALTWYPEDIHIPTLQIGGWYDHTIDGMLEWYEGCRTNADVLVRDKQWLLFGPWVHGGTGAAVVGSSIQGELSYPSAVGKNTSMTKDFFAHYLLRTNNGWENTPNITYYALGKDTWNESSATSIASATSSELYLNGNNQLSSVTGTSFTSFVSDPNSPSPTIGGATLNVSLDQGPYDQSTLDSRSDVISFSTGILSSEISVSGTIKISLYTEADQPDADLAVRLVDVYPDGKNMLINDGIRRIRFRNGYTQALESFMTPGQVYTVEIELPFVNYTWTTGHALKIYLSGNSATRWDVNLQNGGAMYTAGTANTATIKIHHTAAYPSKIILPGTSPVISSVMKNIPAQTAKLSPNPAKEVLVLELTKEYIPQSYCITNAVGKQMDSQPWEGKPIAISHLPSGMYFITLIDVQKNSQVISFLKE